jgi:hypothetical protein
MKTRRSLTDLAPRGIWAAGLALVGVCAFAGAASASSNLSINAQDRSVLVTWSPPAGSSGFTLSASATDGSTQFNCKSSTTTCVISGLTNGVAYQVKAQVTDASGPVDSAGASVTPFGPPGAPQLISAQAGDGRVTGTWAPGGANGSLITSYVMSASAGGSSASCTSATTSCTVTGLANGTTYSAVLHRHCV